MATPAAVSSLIPEEFEAAERMIARGQGVEPLLRLLQVAGRLARCPIVAIGLRGPDGFRFLLSRGFPLRELREALPSSAAIGERTARPSIIADLSAEPAYRFHPYVAGPAGLRFQASVPIPAPLLPFDLLLLCLDKVPGSARETRPDLLELLTICADVIAEQLALLGSMARQSERLDRARLARRHMIGWAKQSLLPVALVDRDLTVVAANEAFRRSFPIDPSRGDCGLPNLLIDPKRAVSELLDRILQTGEPGYGQRVTVGEGSRPVLIDAIPLESDLPQDPVILVRVCEMVSAVAAEDGAPDLTVGPFTGSPDSVVSDFLFDTLVHKPRLLSRGAVSYHALSRWRAGLKSSQLAALRALKRNPPAAFVERVADTLAKGAHGLFGSTAYHAIAAVPCGHSGPGCLTSQVANRLAAMVDKPLVEAFHPLEVSGSSHPRRNAKRPAIRLAAKPETSLLLVDDVATSGAHLAECTQLLRSESSEPVFPLVWIGA